MKNSKGITLIALIITIIVMIILVAVTVNVALNGGLFGKAETATTKTTREIEKEKLISAMVGGIQAGGKFDITAVELPDETKWITSKDDTTEVASPNTSGNWVIAAKDNKFFVDEYGNVLDDEPTSASQGWYYSEENGEKCVGKLGSTETTITLTNPIKAEVLNFDFDENGDPSIPIFTGEYLDIDLTEDGILLSLGWNTALKSVDLKGLNVSLSSEAFAGCTALTSVKGLNGLTTIPEYCFEGCTSLTSFEIPNNITSIESNAFENCSNLTQITINKANGSISGEPWGATNATVTWQQ